MAAEGDIRKADGEIYYASEYNRQPFKLASGVLAIDTGTTSLATDVSASFVIAAGDLTTSDIIFINVMGTHGEAIAIYEQIEVNDTSNPGSLFGYDGITGAAATQWTETVSVTQHPGTNDFLLGNKHVVYDGADANKSSSVDTNDANIMGTAFSIKLRYRWDGAGAATTAYLRWQAHVSRG
jgi:hypothetical protein